MEVVEDNGGTPDDSIALTCMGRAESDRRLDGSPGTGAGRGRRRAGRSGPSTARGLRNLLRRVREQFDLHHQRSGLTVRGTAGNSDPASITFGLAVQIENGIVAAGIDGITLDANGFIATLDIDGAGNSQVRSGIFRRRNVTVRVDENGDGIFGYAQDLATGTLEQFEPMAC